MNLKPCGPVMRVMEKSMCSRSLSFPIEKHWGLRRNGGVHPSMYSNVNSSFRALQKSAQCL